jgi:hypothetical protein
MRAYSLCIFLGSGFASAQESRFLAKPLSIVRRLLTTAANASNMAALEIWNGSVPHYYRHFLAT